MYAKERGSFTLSNALLTSTALAALVAGVFSISAGKLIQSLTEESTVSINPSQLVWWSHVQVGFDQADPTLADLLPAEASAQMVQPIQVAVAAPALQAPKIQRPVIRKKVRAMTLASTVAQKDQITLSQARVEVQPVAAAAEVVTPEMERAKLRDIHLSLRSRFQIAVNSQSGVTTQVVSAAQNPAATLAQAEVQSAPVTVAQATSVSAKPTAVIVPVKKKNTAIKKAAPKKVQSQVKTEAVAVAQASQDQMNPNSVQGSKADLIQGKSTVDRLSASVSSARSVGGAIREDEIQDSKSDYSLPAQLNASLDQFDAYGPMPARTLGEMTAVDVTTHGATTSIEGQSVAQAPIFTGDYSWAAQLWRLNTQDMSSQKVAAATADKPKVKVHALASTADPVEQTPSPVKNQGWEIRDPQIQTFEAFDPTAPVYGSYSRFMSHEGATQGSQSRWIETNLEGYWPTLSWQTPDASSNFVGAAQMLSNADALMLARISGAMLQNKTGMVFGSVPAGWRLEFSGRAEAPVYLDEKRERVNPFDVDKSRSFGFVNAAPGIHLLYLIGPTPKDQLALAIPVQEGQATYLNLTAPQKKNFSGMVLDGGLAQPKGLGSIEVRVVGQNANSTFSRTSGFFELQGVYTVSDFPLYFETRVQQGYTHRYRVSPTRLQSLTLYRFSEKKIADWLSPLEGGVSAESGLMVGASSTQLIQQAGEGLYPVLQAMNEDSTLKPETYTLDSEDRLMDNFPMPSNSPRFMSVQIPEGLNQARIEDGRNRIYWSQYVIASPGVVNVILPE